MKEKNKFYDCIYRFTWMVVAIYILNNVFMVVGYILQPVIQFNMEYFSWWIGVSTGLTVLILFLIYWLFSKKADSLNPLDDEIRNQCIEFLKLKAKLLIEIGKLEERINKESDNQVKQKLTELLKKYEEELKGIDNAFKNETFNCTDKLNSKDNKCWFKRIFCD